MRLLYAVFGFRGRLGRAAFLLRVVLILAAFALADILVGPLLGDLAVWLLNPLALGALVAACVRRLHDRDYSGRWLAAGLVPLAGAAWLLWQFLRRGAASSGRFGPDPLRQAGDFLVVK